MTQSSSPAALKEQFLLDPDVVFLNHGSFGATPRPVFEEYQRWQFRLERQPVLFLGRELLDLLRAAREALGDTLHVAADTLAYVPNATVGINIVARSLSLGSGDEILTTDHEYGACDNLWEFISLKTGARIIRQAIPLPVTTPEEVVEQVWQGVTPRTRVLFMSHITSPTALCLPVEALCARARSQGILTVIDGAHAPGQIPLNLDQLGVDFYAGNCHKWLCAPKGAGFLYVRSERQDLIEPLIVSWGWGQNNTYSNDGPYLNNLQWTGTRDPSAALSVPAAIRFEQEHNWPTVRRRCHDLVRTAVHRLSDLTGLPPLYPDDQGFYHQMATLPLPFGTDLLDLKARLYDEHRVEIPTIDWQGQPFVRLSVQGYNSAEDIDRLLDALSRLLTLST